jgi:hypothetical protein
MESQYKSIVRDEDYSPFSLNKVFSQVQVDLLSNGSLIDYGRSVRVRKLSNIQICFFCMQKGLATRCDVVPNAGKLSPPKCRSHFPAKTRR